jgi:3-oxoacyl-[acyl-carrier-protein] synthase II
MTPRRVAVTGIGIVSQFGEDPNAFFDHLLARDSGICLYRRENEPVPIALPAAPCPGFDATASLGGPLAGMMDRYSQMGAAAALAAWRDAGLTADAASDQVDAGVSWGTALGGTLTFEQGYRNVYLQRPPVRLSPLSVVLGMNNACASHIAMQLGLAGACHTFSVACSSSAVSLGEGFRRIRSGECSVLVAGGSDATLSYGVLRAWQAMRVLASGNEETAHRACRPFHRQRQGLVLGEGGGALILEDWDRATRRGARIYAELAGFGASCDHSHLVRPNREGQARALEAALGDAGMDIGEVGYVNAHGTATRDGDPIEISAIRAVFGQHAEALPVSATKSMHGHMLGATGVVEAIATVLALHRQAIPPTAYLDDIDPECAGVRHVTEAIDGVPLEAALSTSFAFGGSNAVLAFRRCK